VGPSGSAIRSLVRHRGPLWSRATVVSAERRDNGLRQVRFREASASEPSMVCFEGGLGDVKTEG